MWNPRCNMSDLGWPYMLALYLDPFEVSHPWIHLQTPEGQCLPWEPSSLHQQCFTIQYNFLEFSRKPNLLTQVVSLFDLNPIHLDNFVNKYLTPHSFFFLVSLELCSALACGTWVLKTFVTDLSAYIYLHTWDWCFILCHKNHCITPLLSSLTPRHLLSISDKA